MHASKLSFTNADWAVADFFDGKHNIILGGSWATFPRIAGRSSLYVTLQSFIRTSLTIQRQLVSTQLSVRVGGCSFSQGCVCVDSSSSMTLLLGLDVSAFYTSHFHVLTLPNFMNNL
jgi:hypothetical protein